MAFDVLAVVTGSVVSIVGFSIPATYVTRYVASLSVDLAKYVREGRARGKRLADLDWSMRHSAMEYLRQAQDYAGPGRGLATCLQSSSEGYSTLQMLQGLLESSKVMTGRIESSTLGKLSLDKEAKKMAHFATARDAVRRLDMGLIIYSLSFFLSLASGKDSCETKDTSSASKYVEAASKSLGKLDSVLASRRALSLNPDMPYSSFLVSLEETVQKDMGLIASLEQTLSSTAELRRPNVYGRPAEFLPYVLGKGRYWSRLADLVKEAAKAMSCEVDVMEFERFVERFHERYPDVESSDSDVARTIGRLKEKGEEVDMKTIQGLGRIVACKNLSADASLLEEKARKEGPVSADDIEKSFGWSKQKVAYLLDTLSEEKRVSSEVVDGSVRYKA